MLLVGPYYRPLIDLSSPIDLGAVPVIRIIVFWGPYYHIIFGFKPSSC